jgi:hypothetical protein
MIVALVALIVALAGTAYAAGKLNGHKLINRSVPGTKLEKRTVTGREVNEATLTRDSIPGGSLRKNQVTGTQIKESTLEDVAASTVPITYVKNTQVIPPAAGHRVNAICQPPTPDVIGGGAELSDDEFAIVSSSFPVGGGNAWEAIVFASKPNITVTVTAICSAAR